MPKKKKTNLNLIKIIIAIVVIIAIVGVGIFIVRQKKKQLASIPLPVKPTLSVNVVKLKKGYLYLSQQYLGLVEPRVTSFVSPLITARIVSLKVREGDHVKKGQCLVVLDSSIYKARVASLKAQLEAAKTALYTYEGIYLRDLKLFNHKALSKEALDKAKMARDSARARVVDVKNQLKTALIQLSYTKIFSPFDAIVTQKFMDVSDVAVIGKPILKLDALNKGYKVVVRIPQELFPLLYVGQQVNILSPYGKNTFISAKISKLFPQDSQMNPLPSCEIYLKSSPFGLPSGSTLTVVFKLRKQYGFIVPARSILHQAIGHNLLFVVSKEHRIKKIPVRVLLQTSYRCCVEPIRKGAISVGDDIVVAGEDMLLRLHEGDIVHPIEATKEQ